MSTRNKLCLALGLTLGFVTAGSIAIASDAEKATAARIGGSTANSTVLANAILDRWEGVAVQAGVHSPTWRDVLYTQMKMMDTLTIQRLDRVRVGDLGNAKAAYEGFAQAIRDAIMQSYGHAISDKTNVKLGSTTTDQVFIPIVPCRVVDTRNVGGQISAGFTRNYDFYASTGTFDFSTQGGDAGVASTSCPGTVNPNGGPPSAAVMTVTVVSPSAAGNWVVWSGANPVPNVSALNWSGPGQILANTTVVQAGGRTGTGPGGSILDFAVKYNGPSGAAHFIADVVGYMVENQATALQCVTLTAAGSSTTAAGGLVIVFAPTCTAGYTKTANGCVVASGANVPMLETNITFNDCIWINNSGGTVNNSSYTSESRCCRVPGR